MYYNDLYLTEEDRMIAKTYRDFVEKEIMPYRDQVDGNHELVDKILTSMNKNLRTQSLSLPEEYGGGGITSLVTMGVIHEELGRGDSGIGAAATVTGWCFQPAGVAGNKAVLDKFAPQFCTDELKLGCFSMTEPGGTHGGGGCDIENPMMEGRKIKTTARLEGDEWVINGQKIWGSNSGVSDLYCVTCTTDPELGNEGIALIYIPHDAEGITYDNFERKAGMEGDRSCVVNFDNVRVPKEYRAAGPGKDAEILHLCILCARINTASLVIGNAQATFEIVLDYTGERVVGNKPIRQHSIAAGILAEMATGIATAREFNFATAYMLDHPEMYGGDPKFLMSRATMAKVYSADVAVMVTNKAMELMGAYGYSRDYHVEKYWRDCKMVQLWEGGVQLGQFDICRGYYDCEC